MGATQHYNLITTPASTAKTLREWRLEMADESNSNMTKIDEAIYNASLTDVTLSESGKAADAKKTGDDINGLKTVVNQMGEHAGAGSIDGTLTSVTPATQKDSAKWTHIDNGFTSHFRDFLIPYTEHLIVQRLVTVFENKFYVDACSATAIRFYNMLSTTGTVSAIDMSDSTGVTKLKRQTDIWIPAEYLRNASGTLGAFTPTFIIRQNKNILNLTIRLFRGKKNDDTITDVVSDSYFKETGNLMGTLQPSSEFLTNTEWNVFAFGVQTYTKSDEGYMVDFDIMPMPVLSSS